MSPKKLLKPLPYLVQRDSDPLREAARWLCSTFKPLVNRRLPTVLYGGFKHGFVPQYVQTHRKTHPWFVKVDIERFYPSLSHHHLEVEAQLAYKNLLGLNSVPNIFKRTFLPAFHAFVRSLPASGRGAPLNSAFAKALAPLVYLSFFCG